MVKNPYENARFERFIGEHGMTALFVIPETEESPPQFKTSARVVSTSTKARILKVSI